MLTIAIFSFAFTTNAQTTYPKLKFRKPQLVAGIDGQVGATYKFPSVATSVDAYITIESIKNGAVLVNIDDSTLGYYDAWQPTVSGPGTYGSSYIKWDIEFKSTSGSVYSFPKLAASAIDVDGDNVRLREFIAVNGQTGYNIPTQIPTQLTVSQPNDVDNLNGDDASETNLQALGPVSNRAGIDTLSQDVRINFDFTNVSKIKIYTGSQVDSNGTTSGIATSRYHCIYFMDVTGSYFVLPVTYSSFNAVLNNNKVDLLWSINTEKDNDHFEVEKSFDEVNFSTAGYVLGAQNENKDFSQYSFKDGSKDLLSHAIIYYRLKQVDADGKFVYSKVVKVVRISNGSTAKASIQVMPNPYMDKLNVNFESDANGKAEIRLMNASGNLVKKIESTITKGNNSMQLQDLNSQSAGMYVVNVIVNGRSIDSQKILKQ